MREFKERIESQLLRFFEENYDGHLYDVACEICDELGLTVEHGAAFSDTDIIDTEGREDAESIVLWNPGMYRVKRAVGKWERA